MAKTRQSRSTTQATAAPEEQSATITVPMLDATANGYQSTPRVIDQIHVTNMSHRERRGLAILFGGLRQKNIELAPFKPVANQADSIRWLLNELADAYGIDR